MRLRILAAVMLTDAPWALASARTSGSRGYYLGAAGTLFLAWPAMVTAGAALGDVLAGVAVASLLPALTLGAVVVGRLRQRQVAYAVAAASVVAVATMGLDIGIALLLAAAAGVLGGVLSERRS